MKLDSFGQLTATCEDGAVSSVNVNQCADVGVDDLSGQLACDAPAQGIIGEM